MSDLVVVKEKDEKETHQTQSSVKMEWGKEKDVILATEVLYAEPYKYKERTAQSVQAWQNVVKKLSTSYPKKFERLTQRGAKEHMSLLLKNFKKKNAAELRASGISPEMSAVDTILKEICAKMDFWAAQNKKEQEKKKEEAAAKDVHLKDMEALSQTKKRGDQQSEEGDNPKPKQKGRSNGSEMVAFLRDRANKEMELRAKAQESAQLQMEQDAKRHDDLLKLIAGQQQEAIKQQQQQFAQMQQMMANQQQQNFQLLMDILQKKN